ncbi:MAG TPA: protein translocase subunit SecF [Acidimicrobiales bacterium]|nr:protein translocase subunit SecF [Acidimicrobiales bacterium]
MSPAERPDPGRLLEPGAAARAASRGAAAPAATGGASAPAAVDGGAAAAPSVPGRPGAFRRFRGAFGRMYRGETRVDFVGRRRLWLGLSATVILAGVVSLGVRGLNFGIDFRGGTSWSVLAPGVTQAEATGAVASAGLNQPVVEILGGKTVQVQADLNDLAPSARQAETQKVTAALASLAHHATGRSQEVSITTVGPNWGSQVTQRALVALLVFFAAVSIYISLRFEPKMAGAAFLALVHDVLVTVGVYSLAGFQVTPDTVIAVLTILGYSLYDTVVVFDRVRDNAKGLGSTGRMTYSEMVNLSMNQTLARSVNTTLVAVLPVLAVLVVGAEILGALSLKDYGLALFVGLVSGAYSSIFIASPLLATFKEREPRYAAIRQRLAARGERAAVLTPSEAAAMTAGGGGGVATPSRRRAPAAGRPGLLRPGTARGAQESGAGGGIPDSGLAEAGAPPRDGQDARAGGAPPGPAPAAPAVPGAGQVPAARTPPGTARAPGGGGPKGAAAGRRGAAGPRRASKGAKGAKGRRRR